jgi:hypothetical protein
MEHERLMNGERTLQTRALRRITLLVRDWQPSRQPTLWAGKIVVVSQHLRLREPAPQVSLERARGPVRERDGPSPSSAG